MGVKLFYYARTGETFVFSNTLNCIRSHAKVSAQLNEAAIGDFLLFGFNRDLTTTTFAEIEQLPPAHSLTHSSKGISIRKYWTLPLPTELRYRNNNEYVEHFGQLLRESVADRARSDSVSILMSGGLDSPALAACAKEVVSRRANGSSVRAITVVNPEGDGDEGYFAGLAAQRIGIPLHRITGESYGHFDGWGDRALDRPEPCDMPLLSLVVTQYKEAALHGRVLLQGYDGDALLSPSRDAYVAHLVKSRSYGRLARAAAVFIKTQRRVPRVPVRALSRRRPRQSSSVDEYYPSWLNPEFEQRLHLRERWTNTLEREVPPEYEIRGEAFKSLTNPMWNVVFTDADPGVTGLTVESRHPFADVRLIDFCLSLPQVPWCISKYILRAAMRGILPDEILKRPKTTFAGFQRKPTDGHAALTRVFLANDQIRKYVRPDKLPLVDNAGRPETHWLHLRPLALSFWMSRGFA
jgi:asparagine synthase (glutamine-hydrolysing)